MNSPKLVEPGKKFCSNCRKHQSTFPGRRCRPCIALYEKQKAITPATNAGHKERIATQYRKGKLQSWMTDK